MRKLLLLILACCLGAATTAFAQSQQLSIEINKGNPSALPITVVPFAFEGAGLPPDTDIAAVMSGDFNRCGQFKALPKSDIVELPSRGADIKYPTWRQLKQDYIVVGRITDAEEGAIGVEFELHDVAKGAYIFGMKLPAVRRTDMRSAAHQIADMIYEKIMKIPGAFWTRMAYVTMTGSGANLQYSLMVADSDGFNPQTVVKSKEPLLSPAWSPDSKKLAYVSFERGNSSIYLQEIATGSRQVLAANKGINGAPAFSPDGNTLALTLSVSGNPEIYTMDIASRKTTQITKHFSIDTEPTWMPDGQSIVFTSDRAGKPQIYQVPVGGGEPTRLTFSGEYNARPTVSYDGKRIAMAQGNGNVYRIAVLDRSIGSGEMRVISPGNLDESPSFAPNGSMLLYATREGSKGVLYAVSANAAVRQRLILADGDVREPAWSPLRQR